MSENLTLADSYALAEKYSLWDKAKCSPKLPKHPCKDAELTQKKASDKPLSDKKNSQEADTMTDPQRNKGWCPRRTPSSQSLSTRSFTTLRTSLGLKCHNP
ncbi:hypothetical protein EV2_044982 [Malus domestica]